MSWFKQFELLERPSSSLFHRESALWFPQTPSLFADECGGEHLAFALDILNPSRPSTFDLILPYPALSPLALVDDPFVSSSSAVFRRLQERSETELYLQSLSERVASLELGFDRALRSQAVGRDRKYSWTAEIKGAKADDFDRKYKLTAEAKAGEARTIKWTTEIKGKGKDAASRTYTFQASSAPAAKADSADKKKNEKEKEKGKGKDKEKEKEKEKEKSKEKKSGSTARIVEIEDEPNPGAIVIRKTFEKRAVDRSKGKRTRLSPQDAALIIQVSYRAHLVWRSQVLRSLRDLAVAKAKLKELRALFSNFSYRHRIAKDAEERQRFSEKIIVLLLTVDAIEGPDYMVRVAKKSMVEELEAMLEVIDPQPPGRLGSLKRRKFDLPEGGTISKEMSMGVAGVVELLDQEDNRSI